LTRLLAAPAEFFASVTELATVIVSGPTDIFAYVLARPQGFLTKSSGFLTGIPAFTGIPAVAATGAH
jgi:hypothetical protein